jgi:ABC-type phosphate/phosphonate transport system substrate-binding protein
VPRWTRGRLAPGLSQRPITIALSGPGSGSVSTTTGVGGNFAGSYTPTQPGQYTFTASYAGDAAAAAARSGSCTVAVAAPVTTTLSLACPGTSVAFGDPISLSGALSPPLPSRTITITDSGADTASFIATTQANGTYTSTYTPADVGTHTFVAHYAGERGFQPASSASCSVDVTGIIG